MYTRVKEIEGYLFRRSIGEIAHIGWAAQLRTEVQAVQQYQLMIREHPQDDVKRLG